MNWREVYHRSLRRFMEPLLWAGYKGALGIAIWGVREKTLPYKLLDASRHCVPHRYQWVRKKWDLRMESTRERLMRELSLPLAEPSRMAQPRASSGKSVFLAWAPAAKNIVDFKWIGKVSGRKIRWAGKADLDGKFSSEISPFPLYLREVSRIREKQIW